ncbi:MAG: phage integrase N-terminal SAM-like domain-containing protein, partial [Caulobacteraceae bacterium]
MDLRNPDKTWMDRGFAIGAADSRALWARLIREAHVFGAYGEEARANLRLALEALPAPKDAADRHARFIVADLIEAAQSVIKSADTDAGILLAGAPRTVDVMIDGYFADPSIKIADATRRAYTAQAKRIRAQFGSRRVDELTRGDMRTWYVELVEEVSVSTANLCMEAFGAFYKWGGWQNWTSSSPVRELGKSKPVGRRVYWTMEEEEAFVAWCD